MSFQLPTIDERPVTVLGAGVLGRRIATSFASVGFGVRIRDPDEKQRAEAVQYWEDNADAYSNLLGTHKKPGSLEAVSSLAEAVDSAWLIVEAIPEQLQLKIDTFAELEKIAPKDAILASNSSSFKSSEIAGGLAEATRQRILNTHFLMPPEQNLVELMSCGHTAPEVIEFVSDQVRVCGLVPIVVAKESTGFLFNRMWAAIKREAISMVAEGVADPETIDTMYTKFIGHFPPFETMDQIGLDTVQSIEKTYVKERGLPTEKTIDFLQREYISKGKLGKKSGNGGFLPQKGVNKPGRDEDAPTLYFLDIGFLAPNNPLHGGKIISARADGTHFAPVVSGQSLPDGLDIDEGRIYWSNMGIPSENDGHVQSCKLDGSDIKDVIPKGRIHTPKQVMLDKSNKKLYVSDREGLRVFRCEYDGSGLEVIWKTGDFNDKSVVADQTKHCVGIAIDDEYFYWTQKGAPKSSQGRIMRAPKNAKVPEDPAAREDVEVLFENLPEPIDLEVDQEGGFLYWTDRGELPAGNSINRVALEEVATGPPGEHKHEILVRNMHEAIGLKLDPKHGHMYSTDIGGTVYRFNLDGTHRQKMYDENGSYTGIAISYD